LSKSLNTRCYLASSNRNIRETSSPLFQNVKRVKFLYQKERNLEILLNNSYDSITKEYFNKIAEDYIDPMGMGLNVFTFGTSGDFIDIYIHIYQDHLVKSLRYLYNYYVIFYYFLDLIKKTELSYKDKKENIAIDYSKCIDCNTPLEKIPNNSSNPKDYLCSNCVKKYKWNIVDLDLQVHYSIGKFLQDKYFREKRWKIGEVPLDRETSGYLREVLRPRDSPVPEDGLRTARIEDRGREGDLRLRIPFAISEHPLITRSSEEENIEENMETPTPPRILERRPLDEEISELQTDEEEEHRTVGELVENRRRLNRTRI